MNVTALSAGNSAVNPDANDIFSSEENILRALSFVRHSPAPLQKKDELRDLFLNYTGSAEADQQKIKTKILVALRSVPELASLLPKEKISEEKKTNESFGTTRPTPAFGASTIPKPEASPTRESPLPQVDSSVAPVTAKAPTTPTPQDSEPPKTPVVSETPPPMAPVTPAAINPNAKVRIDAIKHDINSRVGNPVNLIDADETVGREYMTALLDAMKQASKGNADLARLESAYQSALKVIGKSASTTPPETASQPATPEPALTKAETKTPVTATDLPIPEEKIVAVEATAPQATIEPSKKEVESKPKETSTRRGLYHRPEDEVDAEGVEIKADVVPQPKPSPSPDSEPLPQKRVPPIAPTITPIAPPVESTRPAISDREPPMIPKKPAPIPEPVKPTPTTKDERLRPLNDSQSTLPQQISKLKAEAKEREEAAKKPITDLKAPEIDQGLRQLLAEWTLFKGGSFFRTKPLGIDHPLYKQLNNLPMASIVAGRFEGATPEIRHNLADYMTGWRYEQGILHEMGETFENYLRRVVKEILKKQRGGLDTSKGETD